VTVVVLALLFGAYAFGTGVAIPVGAFRRVRNGARRPAYVVLGLLSVVAAVVAWVWSDTSPHLALVVLVGAWALVTSAMDIRLATRVRGQWLLLLTGVASIVAGVLILLRPTIGAVALAVVIGVYAIVAGVLLLAEAWREQHPPYTSGTGRRPPGAERQSECRPAELSVYAAAPEHTGRRDRARLSPHERCARRPVSVAVLWRTGLPGALQDEPGQLHPGMDAELAEDLAEVEVDGVPRHEEPPGRLGVREPFRDDVGNLPLGFGEAGPARRGALRPGPVAVPDP